MRMLFLALLAGLAATLGVAAQNNPYEIDDECYEYFRQCELLAGKEGFDQVNEELMRSAIEKKDTKAQTLCYVEKLKNRINLVYTARAQRPGKEVTPEEEQAVLQAMNNLKKVARELAYPQYFYYAYDLTQNFYYNTGQFLKMMDMVQEMQETAHTYGEDYGVWMGDRYLVNLYVQQNDYLSAKKYILRALDMFQKTDDPIIKRQSATRLYCDLADCYPIGNDSVLVNIVKAEAACKQHLDTLRCMYYRAKLSAYQKDTHGYEKARDYCIDDPFLPQISRTAQQLFKNLDNIVYTRPGYQPQINVEEMTLRVREVKYIANVAESYNFKELAFELEKRLVAHNERLLSESNRSKLTELDARLGNKTLSARVDEQEQKNLRITRLVAILMGIILLISLAFSLIHIRNLKRTNEKVRLADAAKTRFVQNMSHEVRTPLNAIVGFSQLLALPDGSFPQEEKEEFSGHIVNNTKMLTMLLDDILNASAMDSGNYRITYEEGEVNFMAQAAISSTEHRLQPGVKMYYAPESQEPFTFRTDPRRVQQSAHQRLQEYVQWRNQALQLSHRPSRLCNLRRYRQRPRHTGR